MSRDLAVTFILNKQRRLVRARPRKVDTQVLDWCSKPQQNRVSFQRPSSHFPPLPLAACPDKCTRWHPHSLDTLQPDSHYTRVSTLGSTGFGQESSR